MGKVLTYALLAVWSLVCVFPLYWVAITSLKSETAITEGPFYIPFVDFTPSLGAWAFVLADANDNLLPRYFNSAFVSLASTLFALFLGGAARRNHGVLLAILATRTLPPVVIILPIYMMAQFAGLLDTRLALIFTYTALNLPVAVWLLQPIFGARATAQEEAAQLDGASQFQIFFTIFLPMVAASIAAVGLLIFILCWNEYLFAAYLAGNHAMTLPPWLVGQMSVKEAQIGSEAEEWAHLSAATILMAAPLLTCTVFVQRFLGRMTLWSRLDTNALAVCWRHLKRPTLNREMFSGELLPSLGNLGPRSVYAIGPIGLWR